MISFDFLALQNDTGLCSTTNNAQQPKVRTADSGQQNIDVPMR
jgi:hypothetical protein